MIFFAKLKSFGSSRLGVNMLGTALSRLGTVAISLYIVRVALDILPASEYGIWLTLASILAWIHLFDVGLGNGLRNHLAAALTRGDISVGKEYISCAYLGLGLIALFICAAYFSVAPFLNWPNILNTELVSSADLASLAKIVALSVVAQFFLKIISSILYADQKAWLANTLEFFGSGLTLASLLLVQYLGKADLLTFGIILSATPVISLLLINIVLFSGRYRHLRPSLSKISWAKFKTINNLGLKFFAIQMAVLILFQATNLLIAKLYSPAAVAEFQITVRYYGLMTLSWSFIMVPLWSAFTEAVEQKNQNWAHKTIRNLYGLYALTCSGSLFLYFLSNPTIAIWTNGKIVISPMLNYSVLLYTLVLIWNNIHAYYLNGASQLRLQIKTSLAAILLFPVAVFCLRSFNDLGSATIVISVTLALSIFGVFAPREVRRHIMTI